jgi:hypothetical protein
MMLKERSTGDPELSEHPYYNGLKICGVCQFNTIFLCRLKFLAEQRVSTEVMVTKKAAVDFGFGSQESSDAPPSPPLPPPHRNGSGSNKRGHGLIEEEESPDAY